MPRCSAAAAAAAAAAARTAAAAPALLPALRRPAPPQRRVCVFDRSGRMVEEISLPPPELPVSAPRAPCCTALQWDPSAEVLAMLPAGNTFVYLWHAASRELQRIDSDFRVWACSLLPGRLGWWRGSSSSSCCSWP
jgi:hypothetical protein